MTEEEQGSEQKAQRSNDDALLELYRQLMESQRDNPRITYSWIGDDYLVLTSALILFGLTTQDLNSFIPAMVLGIGFSITWALVTEVIAAYIRDRFRESLTVEQELGIGGMAHAGARR